MRILAEYPQYQNSAIEACRYLLNSYMSIVHSMFSSQSNVRQRKVVLKLLTAIVSLDSNLSNELLTHLSLQQQALENLVHHTKPTDPQSVRTCFIHFVLAFLVDRNTTVIRTLLDKHHLLSCIFSGLVYDSKMIISLVLSTIKMNVLENTSISKTTKLHMFNTTAVSNLLSLYDWKGPNNWRKNKSSCSESEEFLEDKQVVNDIVHEFLIVLLTSHRYGVIFHDRTLGSRNKHNQLVYTVLQNLEKPWEREKSSDLVIRIMGACPDLIRSQYSAIEPFLEPRVSPKWISLLRFVNKIIESIDPTGCIRNYSLELNAKNLISILLSLTVPNMIVRGAILPGLSHDSLLVRHEALALLLSMICQLKTISLAAKEFYKTNAVKRQITDFILKVVPNLDIILRTWNRAFEANADMEIPESAENVQNPELMDHLDIILNILHLYKDVCPELLDGLTDLQPKMLLSSLNSLQDESDEEANIEKLSSMKVKAIQFLLVLDSTIFAPRERTFKEALLFLISLIRRETPSESCKAARMLLNATGLFENCDDQLDIWINGFSVITEPKENEELAQWFMSVMKSAIRHTDKYINSMTQAEAALNEQCLANLDVKTTKDIINELFEKANRISSPCEKDVSTTSVINGQFNVDAKDNNVINDTFNRANQIKSKGAKHTETYVIQRNEQGSKSHIKKVGDVINQLFDKAKPNRFPFNGLLHGKASPPCLFNGQVVDLEAKKTDDVTDHSFDNLDEESLPHRMQVCTSVSPLLCCALHKANKQDCSATIVAYVSYVLVHTLHHQVAPDLLIHLATDLTSLPVYKYLQGWSSNGRPIPLKNKFQFLQLLHRTSNALLADSEMDVTEVFKTSDNNCSTCCFKYDNKEIVINHSLSLHDVKVLWRMTVFYLAQLAQRRILKQIQNENCKLMLVSLLNIIQSVNQKNMKYVTIVEENAKYIFTHPILLHYFSPFCGEASRDSIEGMITKTILDICETVVHLHETTNGSTTIYNMFFAFREKYLMQLRNIMEKDSLKACSNNYNVAIALLKILQLRTSNIANLLLALTNLESTAFISNNEPGRNQSIFGCIVPILLDMYCDNESKLHHGQSNALNDQFVKKLSLHLVHLKSNSHIERWEQSLTNYLSIFPRNIAGISSDTFVSLLERGITRSTVQLVTILIKRNIKLIPSLVKYFFQGNNAKQADVVQLFPILGCNLKDKWNKKKFLQTLCHHYSNDIAAYLSEPGNPVPWIEENTAAIVYLIENTFDLALCEKTCNTISQSGDKLDMVSTCFVHLLESLYKKYEESLVTVKDKALSDLIQILLHIMTLTLKKEAKNLKKIKVLCEKLDNAVACLRKTKPDFILSSLSKSYSWSQYTRFSLKLGLKDAKNDETQSSILKTLSSLCDIAYADNIEDEYAKTLFEMATSHSEFVNVMLGSSIVKGDLIELLRILIRKNHSVISASHVALYLAAYNATLSHIDQRILQILQHYESHGVKLQQYWPYLWGSAAASHYAVKGETETALWRQPSTTEIFNLFDKDIVKNTIKDYPIRRTLKDDELHENSNVYDPAFYLPLLCSLLAENNIVACYKINQNGVLALVLIACCSSSSDVRLAAYTALSRYYFHLEASKSKDKLLWMRLLDALRNGVKLSLNCPLKDIRLSCLTATFLARASLIASQPLHPLYSPLHTFLMAKPALDLTTIPELLQLLHSPHVEHKAHRHWILKNIRDGMKEEGDVDVALKCMLFRMLLDFHTCILSDAKSKQLILEVIASTTKISKASVLLIRGYGVLPWLHKVVNQLDTCETEIDTVITIIENLLNNLSALTEDTTRYKFLLFSILSQLKESSRNNQMRFLSSN
ncbi:Nucleolar pre-ribosomal-associated protein [Ooceraea biroi]|uniref:Nucleolar pre-ribosomal-associated protein n=2 Tax=Ooceraea biroi TaxID=2015173 RepID=A0A026WF18_OOCBI|nr:Nucleolar pre-ribosomal-associated protein [Ooceraea biroi]